MIMHTHMYILCGFKGRWFLIKYLAYSVCFLVLIICDGSHSVMFKCIPSVVDILIGTDSSTG